MSSSLRRFFSQFTVGVSPSSPVAEHIPVNTVLRLNKNQTLSMTKATGICVSCSEGALWITHDGDPLDVILEEGQTYAADRCSRMLISAVGGSSAAAHPERCATSRGFLPRGLSDACPLSSGGSRYAAGLGQASDKPKQNRNGARGFLKALGVNTGMGDGSIPAPWSAITGMGTNGFQRCTESGRAKDACNIRPYGSDCLIYSVNVEKYSEKLIKKRFNIEHQLSISRFLCVYPSPTGPRPTSFPTVWTP